MTTFLLAVAAAVILTACVLALVFVREWAKAPLFDEHQREVDQ